jgi:Helicase associated domain
MAFGISATEGAVVASSWGKSNTERWERGFTALSKFRTREGHCCPSRRHLEGGYELGQWVSVQRYRKDVLPVERKRRLDAIGFIWDWRGDYLWEQNFAALLKFKRRKGHCCVPTLHRESDLKLGWWVATQRRNRKEMSAERLARLNRIGFVWNAPLKGRAATALKVKQKLRQLRHS